MKKILTAVTLAIAFPAIAHAQAAPAPATKMDCCKKMAAEAKESCCKDMAKMMGHSMHDMKAAADAHAGHDMSGAKAPAATPQNQ